MAIFIFILGLLLVAAGAGGLVLSLDLLPTDVGLLYAGCGTMAVSAGVVTLAIGGLTRRVDALAAAHSWRSDESEHSEAPSHSWRSDESEYDEAPAHAIADRPAVADEPAMVDAEPATRAEPATVDAAATRVEPAFASAGAAEVKPAFAAAAEVGPTALAGDEAVDEDRAGLSPTMAALERALGEPAAAPTLVGSYSAGGADYKIFSDGSIEAETESGAYRFASMNDFKTYLAGGRG